MASALTTLLCGNPDGAIELGEILLHLGNTIDFLLELLSGLRSQEERQITVLGPYIGRSLLEISMTTLIGRFDPFRVLVLREMQRQPEFDVTIRRRTSIQWQGDIISSRPPTNLWSPEKSAEDLIRALLGDYYDHVFWRGAHTNLLDNAESGRGGLWMTELRLMGSESFAPRMRTEASRTVLCSFQGPAS